MAPTIGQDCEKSNEKTPHQAWDWVLPIKTEICLSSGAAVSLLGGFGGMLPPEIFFNRYSLLQSGSIKIHMYCTKKKKKKDFFKENYYIRKY